MMIKISVVIPVYNSEKFLEAAIDSVRNQTLKELEIILVDDESTDKSGEICDEYALKDDRIRVFHKKNGGGASARNYGAKYVTGEYLYYMDCDDLLSPTQLEKMYKVGKKTDADMVYVDAIMVDPQGNKTELNAHRRENIDKREYTVYDLSKSMDRQNLQKYHDYMACRAFWYHIEKTSVYKDIVASYTPNDDTWGLFEKLQAAKKIAFIHEGLYIYRHPREGSIMYNFYHENKFSLYGIDTRVIFAEGAYEFFGENQEMIDYRTKQYIVAFDHIDYYQKDNKEWLPVKEFIIEHLKEISRKASFKHRLKVFMIINALPVYRYYRNKLQRSKLFLKTI